MALRRFLGPPRRRFAIAALFLLAFLIVTYFREQALAVVPLRAKLSLYVFLFLGVLVDLGSGISRPYRSFLAF